MKRTHLHGAIALALAAAQNLPALTAHNYENPQVNDPYKPRPRTKGEKARNRRHRQ